MTHRHSFSSAFLLTIALLSGRLSAVDSPAKVVEPFLDEQAFGVVRVDLRNVDAKALEAWVVERIQAQPAQGADAKQVQDAARALGEPRQFLEQFVANFRAAGGQEIYIILSAADLLVQQPPPVLVPLGAGADVKKIEAAFTPPGEKRDPNDKSERIGDVLVLSQHGGGSRMKVLHEGKAKRAPNPELAAALDAGNEKPAIQIAIAPSAEARRAFEELAPTLPPQLGGGPTRDLTHGFRWASVNIKLPPEPSLRVVIQSPDAPAAESLDNLIKQAIESGVKALEEVAKKPDDPRDAAMMATMTSILPKLAPVRDNDRLVLALDERGLGEMSGLLTASLVQARTRAMQVQSLSNIRQQLMAGFMYANENKGQFPDDLKAVLQKYEVAPQAAVLPMNPKAGYTYLKPPKGNREPSSRIVLYEAEPFAGRRGVGFADGHAELMNEDRFQEAIKAQQAKDKEAPAAK